MATIYKAEDVFKPLTAEQKRVVEERLKPLYEKYRGKIQYAEGDIFNLSAN